MLKIGDPSVIVTFNDGEGNLYSAAVQSYVKIEIIDDRTLEIITITLEDLLDIFKAKKVAHYEILKELKK